MTETIDLTAPMAEFTEFADAEIARAVRQAFPVLIFRTTDPLSSVAHQKIAKAIRKAVGPGYQSVLLPTGVEFVGKQ